MIRPASELGVRDVRGLRGVLLASWLAFGVGGCALVLGIDDLTYIGGDGGGDAASDIAIDHPTGDDGGVLDAACEAAVATDPLNCGACGHDCLGGACDAGVCQPFHVTTGSGLLALATDGTSVFLRSATEVHVCGVGGCTDGGALLATIGAPSIPLVDVTPTAVAWNDGTHIYACAATGCAPKIDLLQSAVNTLPVVALAVSDAVVWLSQATGIAPYAYRVGRYPLGGGTCTTTTVGASDAVGRTTALGFDLYWTEPASSTLRYCQGSCGTDASTAATTALTNPTDLFTDGTTLWVSYVNGSSGGVARVRPDLGTLTPFATSNFVTRLRKDAADLYFVEANQRQVKRCTAPDGAGACTPEIVRQAQGVNIADLAMDAKAIYWIENSADVWRLAR